MSQLTGPVVARAAAGAGFTGDALVTIVAIGHRESGWDDTAQGDLTIQTGEWGPSVGVWQIRTLKAETGTGSDRDIAALLGHLDRQAAAAWTISGHGSNWGPWQTPNGLAQEHVDAAVAAVSGVVGAGATASSSSSSSSSSSGPGGIVGLMDTALADVLGFQGTVNEWATMLVVRSLEVTGGAILFAVGLVMFLDIIGQDAGAAGAGTGLVARSIRTGVDLAKKAAVAAAA